MVLDDLLIDSRVSVKGAELVFHKYGQIIFDDYLIHLTTSNLKDNNYKQLLEELLVRPEIKKINLYTRPDFDYKQKIDNLLEINLKKSKPKLISFEYNNYNVIHAWIKVTDYFKINNLNNKPNYLSFFSSSKPTTILRWDYPLFKIYSFDNRLSDLLNAKLNFERSFRDFSNLFDFDYLLKPNEKSILTKLKKKYLTTHSISRDDIKKDIQKLLLNHDDLFNAISDYYSIFKNNIIEKNNKQFNQLVSFLSKEIFSKKIIFDKNKIYLNNVINLLKNKINNINKGNNLTKESNKQISIDYDLDYRLGNLNFYLTGINLIKKTNKAPNLSHKKTIFMDIERPFYDDPLKDIISWNSMVLHSDLDYHNNREYNDNNKDKNKTFILTVHNLNLNYKKYDMIFDDLKNQETLIKLTAKIIDSFKPGFLFAYNYIADFGEMKKRSKHNEFSMGLYKNNVTQDSSVNFFRRLHNKSYQLIDLFAFMKLIGKGLVNRKLETVSKFFLGDDEFSKSINYDEMKLLEMKLMDEHIPSYLLEQENISDKVKNALSNKRAAARLILDYSANDSIILSRLLYKRFNWIFNDLEEISKIFDIPPYRAFTFSSILDLYLKKQFEKNKIIDDFNIQRVNHDFFFKRIKNSNNKKLSNVINSINLIREKYNKKKIQSININTNNGKDLTFNKIHDIDDVINVIVSKYKKLVDHNHGIIKDFKAKFKDGLFLSNFKPQIKNGLYKDVDFCYLPVGSYFSKFLINVYGEPIKNFVNYINNIKKEYFNHKTKIDFHRLTFLDTFLSQLLIPTLFDYTRYKVLDSHNQNIGSFKYHITNLIMKDFDFNNLSFLYQSSNKKLLKKQFNINPNQESLFENNTVSFRKNKIFLNSNEKKYLKDVLNEIALDLESRSQTMYKTISYMMGDFNLKYGNNQGYIHIDDFDKEVKTIINKISGFLSDNHLRVVGSNSQLFIDGINGLNNHQLREFYNLFYPLNHIDKLLIINGRPIFKQFNKYNINLNSDGGFHTNRYENFYLRKTIDNLLDDNLNGAESLIKDGLSYFDKIDSIDSNELKLSFLYKNKSKNYFIGFDKRFGKMNLVLIDNMNKQQIRKTIDSFIEKMLKHDKNIFKVEDDNFNMICSERDCLYFIHLNDFIPDIDAYKSKYIKTFNPFLNYITKRRNNSFLV